MPSSGKSTAIPRLEYQETQKIRVEVDELKIGMFVSELDRPWSATRFVFQGFLLKTPEDIAVVQEQCDYVYIDQRKSFHLRNASTPPSRKSFTPSYSTLLLGRKGSAKREKRKKGLKKLFTFKRSSQKDRTFSQGLKQSVESRNETHRLLKEMMEEVRLGKSIDTPTAKEAVAACVDNVIRNQDACLLLTRLRDQDQYTSEHSLNVAILSIAFGRHLGLDRKQLELLGLCGLMHDMGKMLTPSEILNKPDELEPHEMEIMKRHPVDGREILEGSAGMDDLVITTAYAHHEKMNGEGYPRGIGGTQLPFFNRIVTIVDMYDAITADRIYRTGETPERALGILHRQAGDFLDAGLVEQFIQIIGLYPLGSIVEMTNGEVGLVIDNNPSHRLRPSIKLLLDPEKRGAGSRIIDLSKGPRDSRGQPYRIKTSHPPGSFGIDLSEHVESYVRRA